MLSPRKTDTSNMSIHTQDFPFEYIEEVTGMTMHGVFPNLFVSEGPEEGKSKAITILHTAPTAENVKDYIRLQRLINNCINRAEYIKSQLHIAVEYLLRHTFKARGDKQSFKGIDGFMQLKAIFLDKAGKLPTTKALIKDRPHGLNQFILDRNIYTHGILKMREDNKEFVIQYLEKRNVLNRDEFHSVYAVVNEEIIHSYHETAEGFRKLLEDFKTLAR
jgi:hypothetical protein